MTGPARPVDWHPLADADPVPGDPGVILEEVAHLRRVAAMLRAEAKDLRIIAEGQGLTGHYAEALRGGARELETRLRETAGRYERVHSALTGWAGELEGFQSDADRILRAARAEVAAARDPAGSGEAGGHSGSAEETGTGTAEAVARHRRALAKVTAHRDERAAHYAARARDEIDDTIKDSWWEGVKDTVDDYQSAISYVVDVMSWVATGIAIAALTMTPAGWVAGLAVWLTFGVLAGHALLASSGDGSWADVAMDVFGLLTMQVGTVALANLRNVRNATKLAAELAAEDAAMEATARGSRSLRDRTSAIANRRTSTRAARAKARHTRNIARAATRRAGQAASDQEAAVPMAEASRWSAAAVGGDKETANLHKDVKRLRAAYSDSPTVQQASLGAERHYNTLRTSFASATAVDLIDKFLGDSDVFPMKPSVATYGRHKGRYVREVGSEW